METRTRASKASLIATQHSPIEIAETPSIPQRDGFPRQSLTTNRFLSSLVGIVALGLGLYHIGFPSLWFDEILSVERASQPLPVLWRIVTNSQPNMALYYFLLHFWLRFTALLGFPPIEAIVRLPSAFFAAGAAVLLFLLTRRLFGMLGGLTGVALYIFNTQELFYTQDTRAYSLLLLFLLLGWYALLMVLTTEKRQQRWFICYVVAMMLSVYTHYFSLFIILAQGVALVGLLLFPTSWQARTRRLFRPLFLSLLSITILVIPMLFASREGDRASWIPLPKPKDVIYLLETFGNHSKGYIYTIATMTAFGLLVGLLASFTRGRRLLLSMHFLDGPDDQHVMRYQLVLSFGLVLLCWLFVPIIVSYMISQVSIHLFHNRYLVTVVPAFCLQAVLGVMAIHWRWLRLTVALCLVLFSVVFVPFYYANAQTEDWRTGSLWVELHYQPNDGLVCFNSLDGCQVAMEYYFHLAPTLAHFDADAPGSFSYLQYDLNGPNYQSHTEQAVNGEALQKYAGKHPRFFYIVARLQNQAEIAQANSAVGWLNSHYQLITSVQKGISTIYLYNSQVERTHVRVEVSEHRRIREVKLPENEQVFGQEVSSHAYDRGTGCHATKASKWLRTVGSLSAAQPSG